MTTPKQYHPENLLKRLGLRVSELGIEKTLRKHPDYPSLSSLADALRIWKVDNLAVQLDANDLPEISFPAIAHCSNGTDNYFVVVEGVSNNEVNYYEEFKGNISESLEDFSKKWTGATLILAIEPFSGERNYSKQVWKFWQGRLEWLLSLAFLSMLCLICCWKDQAWLPSVLLSVVGMGLSLTLLKEEYGRPADFAKKLCDDKCKSIAFSKMGKVFEWFSWSELGFVFFTGTICSAWANVFLGFDIKPTLFLLHICALLYVPFSLLYQGLVMRVWCPFCVVVQAIFCLLVASEYYFWEISLIIKLENLLPILLIFGLVFSIWLIVKKLWKRSEELEVADATLKLYNHKPNVIDTILDLQEDTEIVSLPNDIVLGNPEAPHVVTLISNPTCIYCKYAHEIIVNLLEMYPDDLKVVCRFIGYNNRQNQVVKHLLALANQPEVAEAMSYWYEEQIYERLAKKYPVKVENNIEAVYKTQWHWIKNIVQVVGTPTIYLNNKKWAVPLVPEDLPFYLGYYLPKNSN